MKAFCRSHGRNSRVQKKKKKWDVLRRFLIVNLWKKPDTVVVGYVKVNACYLKFH